jgi:hypothetical protein
MRPFSFCLPPLEPTAWHMFYLFFNMLRAFLQALCKFKFLHACMQPYGFFHTSLYVFLKVEFVFIFIWGTKRCLYIILFLEANRVESSANLLLIPQNLTPYQSKVILGSLGPKQLMWSFVWYSKCPTLHSKVETTIPALEVFLQPTRTSIVSIMNTQN